MSMADRGRPALPKPDHDWWESEVKQLQSEIAHHRSVGADAIVTELEARLAELMTLQGRNWRADKPSEMWLQQGRGVLNAQTYAPEAARSLALRIALSAITALRSNLRPGHPIDQDSSEYRLAVLYCNEAADTWGNTRSKRALWAVLEACEEAAVPKRVDWMRATRFVARDLLVLEIATGAPLDTIIARIFREN